MDTSLSAKREQPSKEGHSEGMRKQAGKGRERRRNKREDMWKEHAEEACVALALVAGG